ncbi:MAG: electron transfer flavoprotein subunit alpha/FixB family protein, partial [Bacteroidota bacterium]
MSALVFVELDEGQVKKSSLEAVSYASDVDSAVAAIVFGEAGEADVKAIGAAGATKILHVAEDKLSQPNIMAYSRAVAEAMEQEGADLLVMAKSSFGDPIAARIAVKTKASLVSNVAELPDTSNGFVVKRSIYTGKAFAQTLVTGDRKVLTLKKNASMIKEDQGDAEVAAFAPALDDNDFAVTVTKREKATGDVLLPEADIVVSGGRGLKGPENWGVIEDLAKE